VLTSSGSNVSANNFFSTFGAGSGTESSQQMNAPAAGTYTKIRCNTNAATSGTVTLDKNATATTLTCTFASNTACSGTGSVTLATTDLIDVATGGTNKAITCVIAP